MPGCCKRGVRCEEVREGAGGEVERWVEGGMLGVRVTEEEEGSGKESAGGRREVRWRAVGCGAMGISVLVASGIVIG